MLVTALAPKIGYDKAAYIAKKAHEKGGDMSIDEPWPVDGFGLVDVYTILVMLIFFVPKLLILYPVLWILLFPGVSLNWLYVRNAPQPLVSLGRTGFVWHMHLLIQWGVTLPASI